MPYFSEAIKQNPLVYDALSSSLSDICHHIHSVVAQLTPSEYIQIKAFVDVLPLNHSPTTYPFGGMVLNIQASSTAHKDHRDKIYCVTVPFGDYKDGELVLHEPGLVIEANVGDIIIFPSCDVTHFNLDFEGIRCGMIFYSDRHGDDWVRFRNGWKNHIVVKDD